MAKGWDAVVCVRCNRKVQVQRMLERGHSEDEAARRIDAQIKIEEKMSRSDYVISNDGSRRVLREQIEKVLNSIQEA
jgi:dephospho-CoA kinase